MKSSTLQAEIRKRKPFDLPEQEAHLNLLRTGEVLAFPFEQLFAEHGLSGPQYNVLRILRGQKSEFLDPPRRIDSNARLQRVASAAELGSSECIAVAIHPPFEPAGAVASAGCR